MLQSPDNVQIQQERTFSKWHVVFLENKNELKRIYLENVFLSFKRNFEHPEGSTGFVACVALKYMASDDDSAVYF